MINSCGRAFLTCVAGHDSPVAMRCSPMVRHCRHDPVCAPDLCIAGVLQWRRLLLRMGIKDKLQCAPLVCRGSLGTGSFLLNRWHVIVGRALAPALAGSGTWVYTDTAGVLQWRSGCSAGWRRWRRWRAVLTSGAALPRSLLCRCRSIRHGPHRTGPRTRAAQ